MSFKRYEIEEYGVYNAIIGYNNIADESKIRPVLVFETLPDKHGSFLAKVMAITSKNNKDGTERRKSRYEVDIHYWKEAGLDHESRIKVERVLLIPGDMILSFRGKMLEQDIIQIERKFMLMDSEKFDTPWNFLNWMIREGVKDTIPKDGVSELNNPIQSLDDIEESKQANCIDATVITHAICINNGFKDKIVYMKWVISNTSTPEHLFSMFTKDQKRFYSLQWVGERGEILGPYKSWNECKKESIIYMTKESTDREIRHARTISYILSEEDIKWLNDLKEPITQNDFLDHLDEVSDFE